MSARNDKIVAAAIEEMILPALEEAEVYWNEAGTLALIEADRGDGKPYMIRVGRHLGAAETGEVWTESLEGDLWETGWEA